MTTTRPSPSATPLAMVRVVDSSGVVHALPSGSAVGQFLPVLADGTRYVAALIDGRPASLDTPLITDAEVIPLTIADPEGSRIHRASLGLATLEAARRAGFVAHLGPSMGFGREIIVVGASPPEEVAERVRTYLRELIAENVAFVHRAYTLDDARARLENAGWTPPTRWLDSWRDGSVRLATCGETAVLSMGPLLPSTGWLERASIGVEHGRVFLLQREANAPRRAATQQLLAFAPSKRATDMTEAHQRWRASLGLRSVGDLERECVKGTVQDLIDVAEGFHERRIVSIADEILSRSAVRFICLAGPSSSGKTTFLKRLTTQLRVLGKNPRSLSLDDYYRARSETPRDAQGKVDFEAFDALDVPLLQSHLRALVEGRAVTTARYDFETQTSHPNGGTEIRLGESDVMIIEGLHGLHPGLFAGGIDEQLVFRAFVNVATPLPFDALTEVSVSDVRLIRRIVRDRRQRATTAAENIARWPLVRAGERENIFPHLGQADAVFDSSLVYELCALKVFAERYLLEVPRGHASYPTALRLRGVLDAFVAIETDHVPPTSLLREFVGSA